MVDVSNLFASVMLVILVPIVPSQLVILLAKTAVSAATRNVCALHLGPGLLAQPSCARTNALEMGCATRMANVNATRRFRLLESTSTIAVFMVRIAPNVAASTMVIVDGLPGASVTLPLGFANASVTTFTMIAHSQNARRPAATTESASTTPRKAILACATRVPVLMGGWEKTVNSLCAKMSATKFWGKDDALFMGASAQKAFSAATAPRKSVWSPKPTTSCVLVTVTVSMVSVPASKGGLAKPVILVHAPTTAVREAFALPMVTANVSQVSKESTAQNQLVSRLLLPTLINVPTTAAAEVSAKTENVFVPKVNTTVLHVTFCIARTTVLPEVNATAKLENVSATLVGLVKTA
jgi:hypothetical protein